MAKKIWTIWKYALGSFADDKTKSYDNVIAITRTFIFITYLITNCFIISGVIRHWNNMSHQNTGMKAGVSSYAEVPDKEKLEEVKEKLEASYKEPEGEPSY